MTESRALRLQFAAEGAMLQRGEQGVELGEMGAVLGFELVDFGDARGKGALKIERRDWNCNTAKLLSIDICHSDDGLAHAA